MEDEQKPRGKNNLRSFTDKKRSEKLAHQRKQKKIAEKRIKLTTYLNNIPKDEKDATNYILGKKYFTLNALLKGVNDKEDNTEAVDSLIKEAKRYKGNELWYKLKYGKHFVSLLNILKGVKHEYNDSGLLNINTPSKIILQTLRNAHVEKLIQFDDASSKEEKDALKQISDNLYNKLVNMQLAMYFKECKSLIEGSPLTNKLLKFIEVDNLYQLESSITTNYEENLELKWGNIIKETYVENKDSKTFDELKLDGLEDCMFVRRLFGYRSKVEEKIETLNKRALLHVDRISSVENYNEKLLYMYYTTVKLGTYSSTFQIFREELDNDIKTFDDLKRQIETCKRDKKKLESTKDQLEKEKGELNKTMEKFKNLNNDLVKQLKTSKSEYAEFKKNSESRDEEYNNIKDTNAKLLNNINECNKDKNTKDKVIRTCKREKNRLLEEEEKWKKKERDQEKEIKRVSDAYDTLSKKDIQLKQQKDEVDLESIDKDGDIAKKTLEIAELNQTVFTLNERYERYKSQIESLTEVNSKLKNKEEVLSNDIKEKDTRLSSVSNEKAELETKLKSYKIFSKWRMLSYKNRHTEDSDPELPSSSPGSASSSQPLATSSPEKYSNMSFKDIYSIQELETRNKAVSDRFGYWTKKFQNEINFAT